MTELTWKERQLALSKRNTDVKLERSLHGMPSDIQSVINAMDALNDMQRRIADGDIKR